MDTIHVDPMHTVRSSLRIAMKLFNLLGTRETQQYTPVGLWKYSRNRKEWRTWNERLVSLSQNAFGEWERPFGLLHNSLTLNNSFLPSAFPRLRYDLTANV